jgi:chemosensory pili system protein ChpA (sensor histidine kinase/response regulator)
MTPSDTYLPTFVAEMRGYLAALHAQEQVLASPTRSGSTTEAAMQVLHDLGHTLAGLGATVAQDDITLLGDCLEKVLAQLMNDAFPLPRLIAVPITYLTVYLETRVNAMAGAGKWLTPDAGDLREAERVATMLRALMPATSSDTQPDLATITEGTSLTLPEEEERFPADIQHIIDAFLQSELSRSDLSFLQSSVAPAAPETLHLFTEEMGDDLAHLRRALASVQVGTLPLETLTIMEEIAHKMKGAAYSVGMPSIGAICDMLETMLTTLRQGQATLDMAVWRWLIEACDDLEVLHTHLIATGVDDANTAPLAHLHEQYARIMADAAATSQPQRVASPPAAGSLAATPTNSSHVLTPPSTMRIDVRRLDQLMTTLGTMHINQIEIARLQHESARSEGEIARIIARLNDLHDRLRAERIAAAAHGLQSAIDPAALSAGPRHTPPPAILGQWLQQRQALNSTEHANPPELDDYSEFDFLMNMLGESLSDLRAMHFQLQTALNQTQRQHEYHDFLSDAVQRDVLALRMVPIADLLPKLQLAVRAAADEDRKEVTLVEEGSQIEIDGDIADALQESLVQLVRNAVIHGIESPAERAEAHKTEPPQITVQVAYEGDGVRIAIKDNGRGINHEKLIAAALLPRATGKLISAEEARQMSREEAFALMFLPDVSTAVEIRPLAGRGMGLPTVQRAVESVRGTIRVTSEPGVGTTFTIRIPTLLSTLHGLVVHAGTNGYIVPLADIRRTAPITDTMFVTTPTGQIQANVPDMLGNTHTMPIITLAALMGHAEIPTTGGAGLVVAIDRTEYAIIVDAIGDESDLIIRRVPKHLQRRGVRGATITPQGEVLLILDLPEMLRAARATHQFGMTRPQLVAPSSAITQGEYILVVDDSPSIRRGLELMLQEAGYAVQTARDGLDAIEHITHVYPRLIVLDVEMPQMTGYELLEVLHSHAPFQHLRTIMLTSRTAPHYRDHALHLGAVDYLVKPVTSATLLAAIKQALTHTARSSQP